MNSDSDIYKETLDHEFQTIRNKIDTLCPLQSTPYHSTNLNSIDLRLDPSETSMDSFESSKAKEGMKIDDEDSDLEDDNANHDKYVYKGSDRAFISVGEKDAEAPEGHRFLNARSIGMHIGIAAIMMTARHYMRSNLRM